MSGEVPKLFTNKPKKSKLKASSSTPIAMSSSSSSSAAPSPPPPPPPPPQKESFVRRYRFLWPLLLVVNFSLGAYVLMRTRTKDKGSSEAEKIPDPPATSTSTSTTTAATITENPVSQPLMEPILRAPLPEDQQRELFKWMLEEKRKVRPRDVEEKRRIDEEKAILKQFIRAKSIPNVWFQ